MSATTFFLAGDVMTGRGIDQILPAPCEPQLHEPWVKTAEAYVQLAEGASGPVCRPVSPAYIWGDALAVLAAEAPDLRLVNLETAVTRSEAWWQGKSIHYRMSPENAICLAAAGLQACTLANNHVLDWGEAGLVETLEVLHRLGIATAGAGRDRKEAAAPAILPLPNGRRLLLFSWGTDDSGVLAAWGAAQGRPGVNRLPDLSRQTLHRLAGEVESVRAADDLVVASLHWGGNWGYAVTSAERAFARGLIEAGIDLVHGHSSHHVKGIEVHRQRLILYGCGDLLTDYEGITGHEEFRGDLGLMYFPRLAGDGRLIGLRMIPTRMRRLQVTRAAGPDRRWLGEVLNREGRPLGTGVVLGQDGGLELRW